MSLKWQFVGCYSPASERAPWPELVTYYELDQKYFPNPWTLDNWNKLLNDSAQDIYLAEARGEQGQVLAFILYLLSPADRFAHLVKILCLPDIQRQGLATELLRCSEKELTQAQINHFFLEVEATNTAAIGLYQKFGYLHIHTQRDFYGSGRDALVMERRD